MWKKGWGLFRRSDDSSPLSRDQLSLNSTTSARKGYNDLDLEAASVPSFRRNSYSGLGPQLPTASTLGSNGPPTVTTSSHAAVSPAASASPPAAGETLRPGNPPMRGGGLPKGPPHPAQQQTGSILFDGSHVPAASPQAQQHVPLLPTHPLLPPPPTQQRQWQDRPPPSRAMGTDGRRSDPPRPRAPFGLSRQSTSLENQNGSMIPLFRRSNSTLPPQPTAPGHSTPSTRSSLDSPLPINSHVDPQHPQPPPMYNPTYTNRPPINTQHTLFGSPANTPPAAATAQHSSTSWFNTDPISAAIPTPTFPLVAQPLAETPAAPYQPYQPLGLPTETPPASSSTLDNVQASPSQQSWLLPPAEQHPSQPLTATAASPPSTISHHSYTSPPASLLACFDSSTHSHQAPPLSSQPHPASPFKNAAHTQPHSIGAAAALPALPSQPGTPQQRHSGTASMSHKHSSPLRPYVSHQMANQGLQHSQPRSKGSAGMVETPPISSTQQTQHTATPEGSSGGVWSSESLTSIGRPGSPDASRLFKDLPLPALYNSPQPSRLSNPAIAAQHTSSPVKTPSAAWHQALQEQQSSQQQHQQQQPLPEQPQQQQPQQQQQEQEQTSLQQTVVQSKPQQQKQQSPFELSQQQQEGGQQPMFEQSALQQQQQGQQQQLIGKQSCPAPHFPQSHLDPQPGSGIFLDRSVSADQPPPPCWGISPLSRFLPRTGASGHERQELQIVAFEELTFVHQIGEGGFGKVFCGSLRGQDVAIKLACTHKRDISNLTKEFNNEMLTMSSTPAHPNILRLVAACTVPPQLALVTEFCRAGSLYTALHTPPFTPLPWFVLVHVFSGIAHGMAHLHLCNVLHRDLKSANILMDGSGGVKIADFGLSKRCEGLPDMTGGLGTYAWMAPEVLGMQVYSEKADVYSFGIVMWECLTRKLPYSDMLAFQAATRVLTQGLRPEVPRGTHPVLATLIKQCWAPVPDQRPSFTEIVARLAALPVN